MGKAAGGCSMKMKIRLIEIQSHTALRKPLSLHSREKFADARPGKTTIG